MWYRLYLAKMPRKEYNEMLKLPYDEFTKKYAVDKDDPSYVSIHDFTTQIFELGKYVDHSELMDKVVFEDDKINRKFSEYSFHIASKEVLKAIAEEYHDNVVTYYKNLLAGETEFKLFGMTIEWTYNKTPEARIEDIEKALKDKIYDYLHRQVVNFGEWPITNSWSYEYNVFELARLYREFDEENYVLLYYGY